MTATFDTFTPLNSPVSEFTPSEDKSLEYNVQVLDKLFAAAQTGAVFGAPVVSGNYTIITASEVSTGGGFGSGKGFGPVPTNATPSTGEAKSEGEGQPAAPSISGGGGMGGGGGANGRPLAVIMIGPDGVKVQPIVDATKIALAGLTAFGMIFATFVKIRRAARKAEFHK